LRSCELLIRGAQLIDGSGACARAADIAVSHDTILTVDPDLAIEAGRIVFDGSLRELVERMGAPTVTYTVTARDQAGLLAALAELGYAPTPRGEDGADVTVPDEEADLLLGRLAERGVRVTSATQRGEDLEGAYLRLIDPRRRPS